MFEWIKQGIGYILGWIYDLVPNYGVALILFTFAIKLLLLPLGLKQQKSMTKMQVIQPKLEALKEKYKNDQQKLSQETMKLYKEYNVSPMGGCLPMLIQLPILILLYRVIQQPLEYMLHMSGDEIKTLATELGKSAKDQIVLAKAAGKINFNFLGLDLSGNPNADGWFKLPMLIPVVAAVTTYLTSKVTTMMSGNKKEKKTDEKYCKRTSPYNDKKTCAQVMRKIKESQRIKKSPLAKAKEQARNRANSRETYHPGAADEYKLLVSRWDTLYKSGRISEDEYIAMLNACMRSTKRGENA